MANEGETVTDLLFLIPKITADGEYSHESFGRKALTNLDSLLKSRDITLLTKGLQMAIRNFHRLGGL